ncbi:unnamed protein product [Adineta steineri]|uniref:3CxxC-type domain-containing protein n=1 Tax=Adineta steineri TaxID=433720 RepID=A0A819SJ61_9BILA|nr:unnamed protein product [Adineta steineri]CAF1452084.1 unnamed protein product [Adineta steineri]CAF1487627.1 unnamed protein product [Adineta steineri]CAF3882765.1 unnamed protein product [Adineta steineri]CAF3938977.1 unnamed protein product [Adineta steineri]
MTEELGKKYPCFGEFKCPRCKKKWHSINTWADYGQQCKSCSTTADPYNLQRLYVYICDSCNAKWKWAYVEEGMECIECSSSILAVPLDQRNRTHRKFIRAHRLEMLDFINNENYIDPSKEHRQDLCEKCIILGRPCRETAGYEYTPSNTQTHRRSVSPPISYRAPQANVSLLKAYPINTSNISSPRSYQTTYTSSYSRNESDGTTSIKTIVILAGICASAVWYLWNR